MKIESGNPYSNQPFPLTPSGDKVSIRTVNPLHYDEKKEIESPDNVSESFAEVFRKTLEKVNDQQVESDKLTQKMVFDPKSVDAHEVLIAAEKARISLTFTKTVIDGVVRAYRDLSNLR